jgi:hypothetical protein
MGNYWIKIKYFNPLPMIEYSERVQRFRGSRFKPALASESAT